MRWLLTGHRGVGRAAVPPGMAASLIPRGPHRAREFAHGETPLGLAPQRLRFPGCREKKAKPKTRGRPQGPNRDLTQIEEDDLDILILMAQKEKKRRMTESPTVASSQEDDEDEEADENM